MTMVMGPSSVMGVRAEPVAVAPQTLKVPLEFVYAMSITAPSWTTQSVSKCLLGDWRPAARAL